MVKMIKSLYGKVLAAVKLQTDVSNFVEISLGVKQGELLSPILFILFVNDVHSEFSQQRGSKWYHHTTNVSYTTVVCRRYGLVFNRPI